MQTAPHLPNLRRSCQSPEADWDPDCPEVVKRVNRAKCQTSSRLDAEDMNDTIFEDIDRGSATFDDSAEWELEDDDNSAMNGITERDWTI